MMNPIHVTRSFALAALVGAPGLANAVAPLANAEQPACCRGVDRGGLNELRALGDARLETLRGGVRQAPPAFDAGEREMLRQAQASRPELAALRGGELSLSDRELKIILITAAVVVLLFAI